MNLDEMQHFEGIGTQRSLSDISKIIIHCSAEPPGRTTDAATIHSWHLQNYWSGIGYHYVIRTDGVVEGGRTLGRIGAHCKGHNNDSVGICMIGGLTEGMEPTADEYTGAQWESLDELVFALVERLAGNMVTVHGHNEFDSSKSCPCFDVAQWYGGSSPAALPVEPDLPEELTINGQRYVRA